MSWRWIFAWKRPHSRCKQTARSFDQTRREPAYTSPDKAAPMP